MAWDPDFLSMFPYTVQLAPCTGVDGNAIPTYGADVAYRARVSGKIMGLRRGDEADITPIFEIWMVPSNAATDLTDVKITPEDRLTLPDELVFGQDRSPVIFTVARITDEDGQHHVKLACGWQYHRQGQ